MSQNIEVAILDEYILVPGVMFVGLVTKHGRLLDYRAKGGLKFSEEQKEMFFMSISLYQSMQHDHDESLGEVKYTITERENFRTISIPSGQDTLVIMTSGDFSSIIKNVLKAIDHAKNLDTQNNTT